MSETVTLTSIPHRPPFRFVDEILEATSQRIRTRYRPDSDAPFFRGHYPNHPVMPGVLLCESCFQAGALLMAHRLGNLCHEEGVPVLTRITDARFKRMVLPGQTLQVEVTLDDELDGAYFMTGRVTVADKSALRVAFVCMQAGHEEAKA